MSALPISHVIDISTLPGAGHAIELMANENERAQLVKEFGLLTVERISAQLKFKRWQRDGIKVEGRLRSVFNQECSVTLNPLQQSIDEKFELLFLPENGRFPKREVVEDGELILDFEGDDVPEMFNGRTLDCKDIITEQLALLIDPFARADGASLEEKFEQEETEEEPSPFAILSKLQPKGNA